jgi:hypothetical protein
MRFRAEHRSRAVLVSRLASAALAALLAVAIACQLALADADPASDVLLGTSVFYPYSPPISPAVEKALNAEVAAAARADFPIKVALIGSPVDLGALPILYGKPKQYAKFLGQEISFGHTKLLLVVMPQGFGVSGLGPAATSAAASLTKPPGTGSDALARAAIAAVPRLAAAAGHPLANVGSPSASGSSGGGSALVPALALVGAAIAAAITVLAVRRRLTRGRPT